MNLTQYLAAVKLVLNTSSADAALYPDALITEAIRQALREYGEMAAPVETVLTVATAGQSQSLASITDLQEVILIAWPWEADPGGVDLRDWIVRWRQTAPGTVWLEEFEPSAGDKMLVYYRKRHTVNGLDGATSTTVPAEHEALIVLGAAGWSVEFHDRAAIEAVKGMTPDAAKRLEAWGHQRLSEFRTALKDLPRVAPLVRPAWRGIGL